VFHFESDEISVTGPDDDNTNTHTVYRALFTVSDDLKRPGQRSRTLVRFVGRGIASPNAWACDDCGINRCAHVKACETRLQVLNLVPSLGDGECFVPKQFHPLREFRHLQPELERRNERSILSLPRPPIPFATLPRESPTVFDVDYSSLTLLRRRSGSNTSGMVERPRCVCDTMAADLETVIVAPCTIYDMDRTYSSQIQLYRCDKCDKFSAGPDLGDLGLFNFDNRTIVAQRLIHKFDIYFSGQEGTLSHFCNMVGREYQMKLSDPPKFLHVDEFRRTWFSFVRLQQFEDDKVCPICRESPGCLVADGVTIATLAAKATGSISPPTVPHDNSPVRQWTRPSTRSGGYQLVPSRSL